MDLFLGLIFGSVGTGYLLYAKKTHNATFAITGALLIVYPYVFSSAIAILAAGVILASAPFVIDRLS